MNNLATIIRIVKFLIPMTMAVASKGNPTCLRHPNKNNGKPIFHALPLLIDLPTMAAATRHPHLQYPTKTLQERKPPRPPWPKPKHRHPGNHRYRSHNLNQLHSIIAYTTQKHLHDQSPKMERSKTANSKRGASVTNDSNYLFAKKGKNNDRQSMDVDPSKDDTTLSTTVITHRHDVTLKWNAADQANAKIPYKGLFGEGDEFFHDDCAKLHRFLCKIHYKTKTLSAAQANSALNDPCSTDEWCTLSTLVINGNKPSIEYLSDDE